MKKSNVDMNAEEVVKLQPYHESQRNTHAQGGTSGDDDEEEDEEGGQGQRVKCASH